MSNLAALPHKQNKVGHKLYLVSFMMAEQRDSFHPSCSSDGSGCLQAKLSDPYKYCLRKASMAR